MRGAVVAIGFDVRGYLRGSFDVGFRNFPGPDDVQRGVTASVIKEVPAGKLIEEAKRLVADEVDLALRMWRREQVRRNLDIPEREDVGDFFVDYASRGQAFKDAGIDRLIEPVVSEPRRGRPPIYSMEHYEAIAKAWRFAHNSGLSTSKHIAELFGLSTQQATEHVRRARRKGLLEEVGEDPWQDPRRDERGRRYPLTFRGTVAGKRDAAQPEEGEEP
ncbi:MAG: hypothetical protein WD739_10995 [Actinomycetota bacterium]